MKKSDIYTRAMEAVLKDSSLAVSEQLEILGVLMVDRSMARWNEEQEAKKKEAKENE